MIYLKQRGACEHNVKFRIGIIQIINLLFPSNKPMNLIQIEMRDTSIQHIFSQFNQRMVGKPYIIKRYIKRFFTCWIHRLDSLHHHGCLAHSSLPHDTYQRLLPVYFREKETMETRIDISQPSFICPYQNIHIYQY